MDFVDLRGERGSESGSDNFWPSFTDVMTTVVMIFMITSTILVMRNWDLIRDLRASMEAEKTAAEVARAVSEKNADLGDRLSNVQEEMTRLRMELLRAREENRSQANALKERDQRLGALAHEREGLSGELTSARRQGAELEQQLKRTVADIARLQEALTANEGQLAAARGQLDESRRALQGRENELAAIRQQTTTQNAQLASLQGEYDSLKVKYDKLVRPARSANGKQVVEVRYEKAGSGYRIAMREQGHEEFREMSRDTLEQRLSQLRAADPNRLYVKIVIPDNSGLSYVEAWNFTRDMLNRYDYYYQGKPAE